MTARLNLSVALHRILADIQRRVPEFSHLQNERILFTAGQARRKSRATTRPFSFPETRTRRSETGHLYKPIITYRKKRIRYEITLRPLFFLRSTPQQRLQTIFHELYHFSQEFDGTLAQNRRHDVLPQRQFDKELRPILRRYQKEMPQWIMQVLGYVGEIEMLQWLERPPNRYRPSRGMRRHYQERDLFLGPIMMRTK